MSGGTEKAATARIIRIWWCSTICFTSKFKMYKSLLTSIPYGCETWNMLSDSEKKIIQAFEAKCLRKLIRVSHLEHKTKDLVQSKINFLVGPQEPFLATAKGWKLA